MRLIIGNVKSRAEFGGTEYLRKLPKLLTEYLSVEIKDFFFIKKNNPDKFMGDGYRYFINDKLEFATGFYPMVYAFLKEQEVNIEVIDERTNVPKFKQGEFDYTLPMYKEPAAPHQVRMINSLNREVGGIYFPSGIWNCATNARKTATLAMLVRNIEAPRVLFLVHSEELFKQHYKFYSQLFHVERITSKTTKIGDAEFTMAMPKTLLNRAKASMTIARDLKTKFNIVVVDECHRLGGKEYSRVMQKIGAAMRLGMSGSALATDNDIHNMVIIGLTSNIVCKVSKDELMTAGISQRPTVTYYLNPATIQTNDYDTEYNGLIKYNVQRAELIADIVAERKHKKILINFLEIEHGQTMLDALLAHPQLQGVSVAMIHGNDPDRDQKLQDYIDSEITVMLSSIIMQEGLNVPDIGVLIYAQGGKAEVALNQWSGRTERHDGVNATTEIVDIWDTGKYTQKHSNERRLFWTNEKFDIKYTYEQRNGKPRG